MTTELPLDPAVTRALRDALLESPAAREAREQIVQTIRDAVHPVVVPELASRLGATISEATAMKFASV
ncbi:hypothetical protein, partial [Nocardia niwae]|uniref:hypothetical protein n=1 Tax=Nocardia niwae TaxID=626084 RepID=UPI0033F42608